MKILNSITFLTLGAISLLANDIPADVYKKGQESTKVLLKTLGGNMKQHMKHGGPMEALDFCSQEAYNLTENVNKKLPKGVTVKRITLHTRNPINTPTKDEAKVLTELHNIQKEGKQLPKNVVKQVSKDTYKFYKPLVIDKPVCLKCHGDIANEKLKSEIANRYPDDKALHYKMGDLRGAVVTTIKQ